MRKSLFSIIRNISFLTPLVELSAELADLRRRIERTDTLIDQIVYQLYGLTEEIAVVEERDRTL